MCNFTLSTRWQCFTTLSTGSPAFDSIPHLFAHRGRALRSVQRCTSTRNSLPFLVCSLSLYICYLLCLHPCFCLLCVSTVWVSLPQTWGSCWLVFFVTLYSWTTPFCSSSGGGCQETMMAVPLSPLSVTVTSRGGALGAEGWRQKIKKKHTFIHDTHFFLKLHAVSCCLLPSHLVVSICPLSLCETEAEVRTKD